MFQQLDYLLHLLGMTIWQPKPSPDHVLQDRKDFILLCTEAHNAPFGNEPISLFASEVICPSFDKKPG
jgi:hypothetical protein